ncbi:MAG: glycosyltransferase, partial [Candidatus Firestonebacteria bacterium]|nr:glycosyltransferase [Candidatus Firestonebacteria bacterium]
MKIAMLTSWQEACGIADYAAALVAALRARVEVEVVSLAHGQTEAAYFRRLAQACNRADLVHVQHEYIFFGKRTPWAYRWPDLIRALRVPYVVTSHTWLKPAQGGPGWKRSARRLRDALVRGTGWSAYLEAGQFKGAAGIITHTRAHRGFLIRAGLSGEKIQVLPQGIPAGFPRGVADRARRRWQLTGPVVTLFGFLNPAKGHELALAAWEQMPRDAVLVIAGRAFSERERDYARRLEQLARQKGERVRWTGYLEEPDLADLLAATDVVLMPYVHATASYALSLALATGRPVLASDLAPFREIRGEQA